MGTCRLCSTTSAFIARELAVCLPCIRENPESAAPLVREAHARSRAAFGLPESPPDDPGGIPCDLCVNGCRIPENGIGYCGVRENRGGSMTGVSPSRGRLSWYHDPLPSNCVADWVCPGGTGEGYPRFARCPGPEEGCTNLAVFFHACTFDCLYCQNWQFRLKTFDPAATTPEALAAHVDRWTTCICYFGGDPAAQLPFTLQASRRAVERAQGRILHVALTGITNRRTLENFARAAKEIPGRPSPPLLVASTLLVPGYVDEREVGSIAAFLASLDPQIPYSLLAFHPHFFFADLPRTPAVLARKCLETAREAGLSRVKIGNAHLLA
jgi:pyruvate formate lyase activating enzyme